MALLLFAEVFSVVGAAVGRILSNVSSATDELASLTATSFEVVDRSEPTASVFSEFSGRRFCNAWLAAMNEAIPTTPISFKKSRR